MALDLPLPGSLLSHSHWTVNKTKMSKSLGNVVDPMKEMESYGTDVIRWYLARVGGKFKDDVGVCSSSSVCIDLLDEFTLYSQIGLQNNSRNTNPKPAPCWATFSSASNPVLLPVVSPSPVKISPSSPPSSSLSIPSHPIHTLRTGTPPHYTTPSHPSPPSSTPT